MSLSPGTRVGPYLVNESLGHGGMGEVYRARDTKLGRDVAIKVLPDRLASDSAALGRFEREAQAVAALSHPNILAIFDFGSDAGITYAVSELLEGETLRARLQAAGGALPMRKAIDIGLQITHGMAAAHEKGIVHRDLKPENVFLTKNGQVKILDFGLAKAAGSGSDDRSDAETTAQTDPGTVLGTVGYMSPEQVRARPLDHRTDIFSFGAMLYEMLTGRRAFKGDSQVETMNAILKEDPPEFAQISAALPASLDRIVRRCLEKNPDERFHSAHDLGIALDAFSGSSTSTSSAKAIDAAPAGRNKIGLAAGAIAGLAAIVGAFLIGRGAAPAALDDPVYQRLTFRRGPIFSGRFGPEGQTIVYSAIWEGEGRQIYATRPSSPESSMLPFAGSDVAAVSRSGELAIIKTRRAIFAYAQVGMLARAPLSGGAAREILDDVQDADWMPDGSNFVVSHYVSGRYQLEWPIGKKVFDTGGFITHVRVSPDGNLVAFLDHPSLGDDRGFVAVIDRNGQVRRLTSELSSTQGLAWRTDQEVWFTGADQGAARALHGVTLAGLRRTLARVPANLQLGDIAADGSLLLWQDNARRGIAGRLAGETADRDFSWLDWTQLNTVSRDGRFLLVSEEGDGGGADYTVYLRPVDGSAATKLGQGEGMDISPDGRWVLAQRISPAPSQLVLLPTGAGEMKVITNDAISHQSARFMPDGKQIVFNGVEPGHARRAYLQAIEGGTPKAVTPEGVTASSPLPDGTGVLGRNAQNAMAVYPFDGGAPKPIPNFDSTIAFLRWTPDGRTFFGRQPVPARRSGRIVKVDPATGSITAVRDLDPVPAALSQNGVGPWQLGPDGTSYFYGYGVTLADLFLVKGLR